MRDVERVNRSGFDLSDVIESAAELVDGPTEVSDEYRRGVVELAARICLHGGDFGDAVTVMGYAVCGVKKPVVAVGGS
ncbi:hypothetical protein [Mycobacterium avium]|uniref:hypothetical protein n=1 Tax=Mycobacterium avium TaxID=1764 RepID=UPI0011554C32|nr:hypothetical protein [Mycobacterium avium]